MHYARGHHTVSSSVPSSCIVVYQCIATSTLVILLHVPPYRAAQTTTPSPRGFLSSSSFMNWVFISAPLLGFLAIVSIVICIIRWRNDGSTQSERTQMDAPPGRPYNFRLSNHFRLHSSRKRERTSWTSRLQSLNCRKQGCTYLYLRSTDFNRLKILSQQVKAYWIKISIAFSPLPLKHNNANTKFCLHKFGREFAANLDKVHNNIHSTSI